MQTGAQVGAKGLRQRKEPVAADDTLFGKILVFAQMTQKCLGPQRTRNSGKMSQGHGGERARGLSSAGSVGKGG